MPDGWSLEPIEIETMDGYLLTTYKLKNEKLKSSLYGTKGPVILQHGMFQSHLPFILNQPSYSLAFIMVENGYEVYLGNNRGNVHSRRHKEFSPYEDRFWDFSFDELRHDVVANVNYVYELHSQPVIFIGHSQGAAQILAALASIEELQPRVRAMVCLAPGALIDRIPLPLRYLGVMNQKYPGIFFALFGKNAFLPFIELLRDHSNGLVSIQMIAYFANAVFSYLFSWTTTAWDPSRIELYFKDTPAGTSTRSVVHYLQLALTGKFAMYCHGTKKNLELYGCSDSLEYDLSRIKVPSIVVWGGKDDLIVGRAHALCKQLPNLVFSKLIQNHEHMDSLLSLDAAASIYLPLIKVLNVLTV